ncbi:hypothetical protein ACFWR6_35440 [Streptomyces griseus]|uniref:hypothetical protein n=1 Tax=Streptomyces griseus TaxID=1911 RepID=UPI00365DE83D
MGSFPLPDDLVRAQQEWHATYRALAVPRPRGAIELRRLLHLSAPVEWHPFRSTPDGGSPAARVELRRLAGGDRRSDAA